MGSRDLSGVFDPSSIALVGASADVGKLTGRPLPILERHGFSGPIYPVNPKYGEIAGRPCFPSVDAIGEPVDLAMIMLRAPLVPDSIRDCVRAGVKNVIIISSGFEESPEGRSIGAELKELAEAHSINLVGPNCEGVWSLPNNAVMTFGSAALYDDLDVGSVSVLSQSGSIGGATVVNLQKRGIGCRYFVSLGNETVVGAVDYLEYLVKEGSSRAITMFVEGIVNGERLRKIGQEAARKGIALIALKGADSEKGARASATHTGKIATSHDVYRDLFRQCGIITVDSIAELAEAADVLTSVPLPLASGAATSPGIGVVAPGGSRVLIADECERRGVPLATFEPETEAKLRSVVPSFGSVENPVDATGQVLSQEGLFEAVIGGIAADPNTEAVFVQYSNRGLQRLEEIREVLTTPDMIPAGKPVLVGFLGDANSLTNEDRGAFRDVGLFPAMGPETGTKYLSWLYRFREVQQRASALDEGAGKAVASASGVAAPDETWVTQAAFLAELGIAVPNWTIVQDADGTDSVRLAYPLVAKALPEDVQHKTDLGLIHLNIDGPDLLRERVSEMLQQPTTDLRGVLVQEMASGVAEAVVAVREDPDFGPILTIGGGGLFVELWSDVVHLSLPCTREEIREALARTRFWTILGGYRGGPKADVDALIEAAYNLGQAFVSLDPRPSELELNPLLVREAGEGVIALDVLGVYAG